MMMLVSIDTTPNPNSMKLNLSESLGVTGTYTTDNQILAPEIIQKLLGLEGLQSIFATADFITLNKDPRFDWQPILTAAQEILTTDDAKEAQRQLVEKQGQVQVLVQTFQEIPIQVKVTDGRQEKRVGLSERFGNTVQALQAHFGADYLKERVWADWGVRYGDLDDVAREIVEEIESLIDEATLNQKRQLALGKPASCETESKANDLHLSDADWHERFRALQQLEATEENLPAFVQAFHDEQSQIRRWVAARLASIKTAQSVEALCERLLNDPNVGVRRTAGDSLSDIGDVAAQSAVCQALGDANRLVRWRAARFLAEVGTETALPFLEKARNDSEYEVWLEVEAAIDHITKGSNVIPVWKLMSQDHS